MSNSPAVQTSLDLAAFGNVVPEGYMYYEKLITPDNDLSLPNTYLKWYNLYPADAEITPEQVKECRAFIEAEAKHLDLNGDLGFVILHRAGNYLLLLLTTWRNTNEMWESVYTKDVRETSSYTINQFPGTHRGTYCVWELGIVWHERDAWVRFLSSKRDQEAKLAYVNYRFSRSV
jgi:hypothetical protein